MRSKISTGVNLPGRKARAAPSGSSEDAEQGEEEDGFEALAECPFLEAETREFRGDVETASDKDSLRHFEGFLRVSK